MHTKSFFLAVLMTFLTLGLVAGVGKAYLSLKSRDTAVSTTAVSQPESIAFNPATQIPTMVEPAPAATQVFIPSAEAASLALQAAGEGEELASEPELVVFNGETAYEVRLTDENSIYIRALDGSLLYNSITGTNKPVVSREEALIIAADYIDYYQPVSIAWKDYENKLAYYIRFWNGANVYVDRGGNILAVQYVQYTSNGSAGSASNGSSSSSGSSGEDSSSSESEHEDEDESDDD